MPGWQEKPNSYVGINGVHPETVLSKMTYSDSLNFKSDRVPSLAHGESIENAFMDPQGGVQPPRNGQLRESRRMRKSISYNYTKNLAAMQINKFLHNRPSSDVLIKNQLIQNTMTWNVENVTGCSPSPRNCHTASVIGEDMYILGGYGEKASGNSSIEIKKLDLEIMSWSKPFVAGPIPVDRYSHCTSTVDASLIMFGGFSKNGSWLNDLYILSTKPQKSRILSISRSSKMTGGVNSETLKVLMWKRPETRGVSPSPRAACTSVSVGKKVYYFGGNNGEKFFNDLYCFNYEKMEWEQLQPSGTAPSPRAGHTATLVGQHTIVIFGGGVSKGYSNEIFFLDLNLMKWSKPAIKGTAPCERAGHTAIPILNGTAVLVFGGGYRQKVYGDLHMFDVEMCQWTRPSDAGYLPHSRAGHSCVTVSNIGYFFGGADGDCHVYNDVYSLDTAFLLLKNLTRSPSNKFQYVACNGIGPIDDFEVISDNQYESNFGAIEKRFDAIIDKAKICHEEEKYFMNEILRKKDEEFRKFCTEIEALRSDVKNARETIYRREKERKDIKKLNKSEKNHENAKKETNGVKTPRRRSISRKVKDFCEIFENISLSANPRAPRLNLEDAKKNDCARRKKKRPVRKRR